MNLTPASADGATTPRDARVVAGALRRPPDRHGWIPDRRKPPPAGPDRGRGALRRGRRPAPDGHDGRFHLLQLFTRRRNLTTGEGGMATTASDQWADHMRVASLHGMSRGRGRATAARARLATTSCCRASDTHMPDLQAAIGLHQLASIDARHARWRTRIWQRYDAELAGCRWYVRPPCRPAIVTRAISIRSSSTRPSAATRATAPGRATRGRRIDRRPFHGAPSHHVHAQRFGAPAGDVSPTPNRSPTARFCRCPCRRA